MQKYRYFWQLNFLSFYVRSYKTTSKSVQNKTYTMYMYTYSHWAEMSPKKKTLFFKLLDYSFFGNILKEVSFCLTEKYVTSFLPFSLHNYISWIVFYFSCRRIPSSIWWILTSHETFDNIIIIKYLDDIAWILNFAMLPIHVWK